MMRITDGAAYGNRTDTWALARLYASGISTTYIPSTFNEQFAPRYRGSIHSAVETEVPAAANTPAISVCAKERKHCTTTGSNCVPLARISRRTASSNGSPLRYGREETIASNASITETIRETMGTSVSFNPAGYPLPSNDSW